MNYNRDIEVLLETTGIPENEVFFFDSTPLESEFQKIYDFYCDTLKLNEDYGIKPSHFFFRNNVSQNAAAGLINKQFVISINSGTIIRLHDKFNPGQLDFTSINTRLNKKTIGTDPNTLLYQFALHFTFYHELAHLIQRSDRFENSVAHLNDSNTEYSERKHLEEFDADAFSSLCLASHVIQLYENNYGKSDDIGEFKNLMSVMCSTGINYILSFNGMDKSIYYKENSHPHPVIRITCILDHFLGYTQQHFGEDKFDNELRKEITYEALESSSRIFNSEISAEFSKKYVENSDGIKKNIAYFKKLEVGDKTLALYKRNKLIEMEQKNS